MNETKIRITNKNKNNFYLCPPTKRGTNFTSYQSSAYSARQICNKPLENLVVA